MAPLEGRWKTNPEQGGWGLVGERGYSGVSVVRAWILQRLLGLRRLKPARVRVGATRAQGGA